MPARFVENLLTAIGGRLFGDLESVVQVLQIVDVVFGVDLQQIEARVPARADPRNVLVEVEAVECAYLPCRRDDVVVLLLGLGA